MDDWHGPYYGFQHVDLTIGHGEATIGHYRNWLNTAYPEVARALERESRRDRVEFPEMAQLYPSIIPIEAHHSTWIANQAANFIRKRRDGDAPFFLYLGFPDPHHPFTPPAELAEEFSTHETLPPAVSPGELSTKPSVLADLVEGSNQRLSARRLSPNCVTRMRQYTDAMIHLIDRSVGAVLDALSQSGSADDTVVIFTSDHGDFLGDHELILKDTICAKALVHVPFVMRAPGLNLPSETSVPMSNVDVLPTLCDLAGVNVPVDVQGKSVLDDVRQSTDRPVLVYGYQHEARQHNFSILDSRYRLTVYPGTGERELYDHQSDPEEYRNLCGHPDRAVDEARLYSTLLELHLAADNPSGARIARF